MLTRYGDLGTVPVAVRDGLLWALDDAGQTRVWLR